MRGRCVVRTESTDVRTADSRDGMSPAGFISRLSAFREVPGISTPPIGVAGRDRCSPGM